MGVFERGIEVPFGGHSVLIWPETIAFGLGVLVVLLVFLLWRSKISGTRADAPVPVKKGPSRGRVVALLLACGAADVADLPSGVFRCSGASARVAAYLAGGINPGPFLTCMSTHVRGALAPTPQKRGKGKRPHRNRADTPDPSIRYVITGQAVGPGRGHRPLVKTGISSVPLTRKGKSPRLERQLRARRKAGEDVRGTIVGEGSRKKVLDAEQRAVDEYHARHRKMPPGMSRPLATQERARRAEERARRRAEGRKAARRRAEDEDAPLPRRGK